MQNKFESIWKQEDLGTWKSIRQYRRKNSSIKTEIFITEECNRNPLMSFFTAIDLNILHINRVIKENETIKRIYPVKHLSYSEIRKIVTP